MPDLDPILQSATETNFDFVARVVKTYLPEAFAIPVDEEQPDVCDNGQRLRFTFRNWDQTLPARIMRNGRESPLAEYDIQWRDGQILPHTPVASHEIIEASYHFSFVNEIELSTLVDQAVAEFAASPPPGWVNINNIGAEWLGAIAVGAGYYLLQRLTHALAYQQPRVVFGPIFEGVSGAKEIFRDIKNDLKEQWKEMRENKKKQLPGLGVIMHPNYSVPGGANRRFMLTLGQP